MPSHQHSQPSPHAPSVGLSQSSSTKRRSWIVGIDADRVERLEIEVLQVGRRRLQDHLVLIIVLQPVRVLAIAAILRPARGLHVGGAPRLRPERAQRGRRVKRPRPHLHVVGLQDHAAMVRPVALQGQDQPLERAFRAHVGGHVRHRRTDSGLRAKAKGGGPYSSHREGSSCVRRTQHAKYAASGNVTASVEDTEITHSFGSSALRKNLAARMNLTESYRD